MLVNGVLFYISYTYFFIFFLPKAIEIINQTQFMLCTACVRLVLVVKQIPNGKSHLSRKSQLNNVRQLNIGHNVFCITGLTGAPQKRVLPKDYDVN